MIHQPIISFYDHERQQNKGPQGLDPHLHVIGKVNGKIVKRILIDEGLDVNIISTSAYHKLNLPFSHISLPSLQIKAFNNALCSTIGSIVLPITIGCKTIQTSLYIIEGNIEQYNILLGRPWIQEMECVPSTFHGSTLR